MSNNHSRPWEILPQDVLNLLALHSMFAYWGPSDNGISGWRVQPAGRVYSKSVFVREEALLDEWMVAVREVEQWSNMCVNYEKAWGIKPLRIAEAASMLPDDMAAAWYQRIQALDNLLALYSLQRSEKLYGGGFVVSHHEAPNLTRWIDPNASEESWLEDAKLLER